MKKLLVILALLSLTGCGFQTVDTGHRGVKTRFGKVVSESLPEDLYFYNPFTTDIVQLDVRTQKWDGESTAYTKDVQAAKIHFTLTYGLDPSKAHVMYQTVGLDWIEKLVGQVVHESIKRELGQYEAVKLVAERNTAARAIENEVRTRLAERNVTVSGFQLTNVSYTDKFEDAVEAKVIAEQKAIEEQNRTVQIREQAAQQVEKARGNAEATVLNAKAEAESISIRAKALEQNAKLVEWEAVQRWDGQMPQYMMGGSVPFIQLPAGK